MTTRGHGDVDVARAVSAAKQSGDTEFNQCKEAMESFLEQELTVEKKDDVYGHENAQKLFKEIKDYIDNPGKYRQGGGVRPDPPKAVLLYGPPGTGKTLLARNLAIDAGCAFIPINAADIKSQWQGKSEKNVKALYAVANENAPCVIFIDEVDDMLALRRDDENTGIVSAFKRELDGFKPNGPWVFTICATNYLEKIEKAIWSRMTTVEVDLPSQAAREAFFASYCTRYNIDAPVVELARASEGLDFRKMGRQAADDACKAVLDENEENDVADKDRIEGTAFLCHFRTKCRALLSSGSSSSSSSSNSSSSSSRSSLSPSCSGSNARYEAELLRLDAISRKTPDDKIDQIIGSGETGMIGAALVAWRNAQRPRPTYKTTINTTEAAAAQRTKGSLRRDEIQERAKAYFKGLKR